MAHRLLCIMTKLWPVIQRWPSFHNPLSYERHGIALTSGICVSDTTQSQHPRNRSIAVLAVPMTAFKVQIRSIEAKLSRQQLLHVLKAQAVIQDDESVDTLLAPYDRNTVAIFSMPTEQRKAYISAYGHSKRRLVAIEPACHALWRYARHQRLDHHGWLVATPHQSTLYWPADWPWGYHAEVLDNVSTYGGESAKERLQTVIRRACLMTGNNEPCQRALKVVGGQEDGQRWLAELSHLDCDLLGDVQPIALGAAMKSRQRWV